MPITDTSRTQPKHGSGRLLGASDGPPWELAGGNGDSRLLLVCDHASRAIPAKLGTLGLDAESLDRHIAWDIGAGALARRLSEVLDAPAILGGYSRLVVDCNRYPHDPSAMPERSDGVVIPGNQALGPGARARRLEEIREPYHAAIAARLAAGRAAGIGPALLAIHSFTPRMHGRERPWEVGVLWDTDPRIPVPLMDTLRAAGVVVGDNQPYSGRHPADFTIDNHAEAAGLAHVSIEIRQDLLSDTAGVGRFAATLAAALTDVFTDPDIFRIPD